MNTEVKDEGSALGALGLGLVYVAGVVFLRMAYVAAIILAVLILTPILLASIFAAFVGMLSWLT